MQCAEGGALGHAHFLDSETCKCRLTQKEGLGRCDRAVDFEMRGLLAHPLAPTPNDKYPWQRKTDDCLHREGEAV